MIHETKTILVPVKFLALTLHLIAATMLYFSYQDNIIATYPTITSKSDTLYQGGKTSFLAANTLTVIFLGCQIIILFIGTNLFKENLSFCVSNLHIIGAILYCAYGFGQWEFDGLWSLWALFSLLPLGCEIFSIMAQNK